MRNTRKTVLVLVTGTVFSCLLLSGYLLSRSRVPSPEHNSIPEQTRWNRQTSAPMRGIPAQTAERVAAAHGGAGDASAPTPVADAKAPPDPPLPSTPAPPRAQGSAAPQATSQTRPPPASRPSPVDNAELRSEDGYTCKTARMPDRPEVALVTFDDGSRFALPSDVANRVLTAPGLTDEQKMSAMLTYPNLVEAKSDAEAAAEVARLEEQSLGDPPPDAVSMEIMKTPELRETAFRVPQPIQEDLDALPQQRPQEGASP